MRVAVWHNLHSGGGLRALRMHLAGLLARGHEVEAWCVGEREPGWSPFGPAVRQHVVPLAAPPRAPARMLVPLLDSSRRLRALADMEEACIRCADEMNAGQFDVAFVNTCATYGVPMVARHLRHATVMYLQEPFRWFYEAHPVLPWVGAIADEPASTLRRLRRFLGDAKQWHAARVQARLEWRNVHAPAVVLVNSYFSRESVLRAYGRDARVCYLGVDTTLFRDLRLPRDRYVAGLGALHPAKGVDDAIRTVARTAEPRPALVWIADRGGSDYGEAMARLAQAEGVELRLLREIADEAVVDVLNRASVMLYTSRLEPFGLAPLEANACGTPVVAVAEGGVRETVRDGVNGLLVDRDHDALARAIDVLLNDRPLARQMGEAAAAHVRAHWDTASSIDCLESHLRQVVER